MELFEQGQRLAELHNEQSLAKHRAAHAPERQRICAGVVLCSDCDTPIKEKRLAAQPNATRCIPCQTIEEHQRGR